MIDTVFWPTCQLCRAWKSSLVQRNAFEEVWRMQ